MDFLSGLKRALRTTTGNNGDSFLEHAAAVIKSKWLEHIEIVPECLNYLS